jgi:hypothetical protein
MLERDWGRIIFVSSGSDLVTPGPMIHCGMPKTAQLAISRGLAELTKGTKVTVNSVLPELTRSECIGDILKSIANDPEAPAELIEAEILRQGAPVLTPPADDRARGDRQPGCLCGELAVFGDQRRRPARRRRCDAHCCLGALAHSECTKSIMQTRSQSGNASLGGRRRAEGGYTFGERQPFGSATHARSPHAAASILTRSRSRSTAEVLPS